MSQVTPEQDELLKSEINQLKVGKRTDSAAMLAWFLQTVWRIDPDEVESAICDGGGDKGIDALLVDEDLGEITIFQSKFRHEPSKNTQGDADLKDLVGAAEWFKSVETLDALMTAGPNQELKNLITRQQVRGGIESGDLRVRLVYVTNADLDASGLSYVAAREGMKPQLSISDRQKLVDAAQRTQRPDLRPEEIELVANGHAIEASLTEHESMAIAMVPARQLVKLPGIDDRSLFNRNVRLFAGPTRINRELQNTVQSLTEHRLFPAYHNGLTFLTSSLEVEGEKIRLQGVGVVNGCQSLITLYENSASITDELQVLVKVVETGTNDQVADLITYRSNNQNAVTMRDQRSSDATMRDLVAGIGEVFGTEFGLRTRVGEDVEATHVLENTLAAQLLMAAYLGEPWAAVRKVRLFDQDYRRIFKRDVTPHRLWLLHQINRAVEESRGKLRTDLKSSFASVRFTLVHLVCQVLRMSDAGKLLLDQPEMWLPEQNTKVMEALRLIANEVVEGVNYHIKYEIENDDDYDPKVAFKSKAGVTRLEADVDRDARREVDRSGGYLFTITPSDSRG